uniref:Uncharacterized protein n=1 Tax=Opuntia streptacantha TaxID=393608 RepID=A0A7C8ZQY1_OPUST
MVSPSTIIVLSFISLVSFCAITAAQKLNAYEALETFNFPRGLLPKGALGYDLDEKSGNFRAYLNGSCSFSLEGSYQLKYTPTITGVISKSRLTNLSGISVKVFFLWLNIVEVRRVDDELQFSVGIASANFAVDNFYECPQCGCGLVCDDRKSQVRNAEANPLASSI